MKRAQYLKILSLLLSILICAACGDGYENDGTHNDGWRNNPPGKPSPDPGTVPATPPPATPNDTLLADSPPGRITP